jgi:ribonuclease D
MGRSASKLKTSSRVKTRRAKIQNNNYLEFMQKNLNTHYIETEKELSAMVKHLKDLGVTKIGLDFETASKNSRFGIQNGSVRLIQIGIGEDGIKPEQFVIDCHRVNPKKILTIFKDPKVEKQILNLNFEQNWAISQLGQEIKNIYDPMWAWRVIQRHLKKMDQEEIERVIPGYSPHGNSLAALVQTHLGIELPKNEQASNWSKNNLTTSQIVYAANDSSIMLPLTEKTKEVVSKLGLEDSVQKAIDNANAKTIEKTNQQIEEIRDDSERLIIAIRRAQTKKVLEDIYQTGKVLSIHNHNQKKVLNAYTKRLAELN